MEHIGNLPRCLSGISLDCMGQRIHTGGSGQSLGHRGHHIRVDDCHFRNIILIDADKLTLLLHIGDHIVDGNLSSGSGCGGNSNGGNCVILSRCYSFQRTYILKLGIIDNDTDGLGSIHGRTAADGDDRICSAGLECCYTILNVFNGRVRFDL